MVNLNRIDFSIARKMAAPRFVPIALLLVIVLLLAAPRWSSRGGLSLLVEFFSFLALAQLWNLLAGYAGIVSLGQQAYIGLGGYTLFALTSLRDVPPLTALCIAGCVGALAAMPIAVLVFRLRGAQLAIGTWVVSEVFRLGFSQISRLGAGSGMSLPVAVAKALSPGPAGRDRVLYVIALFLAMASNFGAYWLLRSRQGLALTAIRDNENTAQSSGVNSGQVKFFVYVGTAFGTSLVGALIYLAKFRISPSAAFDINWTSYLIFIVVIGGIGTLEGPFVGALVFFVLREYLADLGSWYLIILGGLAVLVMLKMPAGIWGTFSNVCDIHLFSTRRQFAFLPGDSRGETGHSR
jgi:branched-chain amino acid transport system permease protein